MVVSFDHQVAWHDLEPVRLTAVGILHVTGEMPVHLAANGDVFDSIEHNDVSTMTAQETFSNHMLHQEALGAVQVGYGTALRH